MFHFVAFPPFGFRGLAVLVVLFALLAGGASLRAEPAGRPNVLLIMADDLGCETLGCYGGSSYKTPNLDELAQTGMRFRHAYVMPVCHPTRVALLTGKYPFRLKNPRWGSFPKSEEKNTIGHVMSCAGYATAIAGKWQLTMLKKDLDHPHRLGFDEYCLFGWHEGPRYYDPLIWQNAALRTDTKGRYGPDIYVEFLVDFMKRNRGKPFFAFYSMALCHDVTDDLKQPVPFGPDGHYDTYKQMVEATDVRVGRLVAALDRLKLREKTLILFTGDNGTPKSYIHTAENGKYVRRPVSSARGGKMIRGGKGELTDAGTHVPLIANWPGRVKPKTVVDDLVDVSDFLPTFAELGGAALPVGAPVDGQSFAAALHGDSGKGRKCAYAEGRGRFWVRNGRWKLYNDGGLFDVANDPDEKHPIAAKGQPSEAAAARARLQQFADRLRPRS